MSKILREICEKSLKEKGLGNNEKYVKRLDRELEVIESKNFSDYFLIIKDIVEFARSKDIIVGIGRGSAPGSLVTYLTGITGVDPLEHDLLFERFISPYRVDWPDVDIDFSSNRREEVVEYIIDKYGEDSVANIPTLSRFKARSALRDLGRIFGAPIQEVNAVTKAIPINRITAKEVSEVKEVQDFFKKYPLIGEIFPQIVDSIRHKSIHAAGLCITPGPITDYLSTEKVSKKICVAMDMDDIDKLGFLKLDMLGLITLDVIGATLEMIGDVELPETYDDPKVYEIFKEERTLGIFQFETSALTRLAMKLRVKNFNELMDASALVRPAPIHSGQTEKYINIVQGTRDIDYIVPELEPITGDTKGILIYQEQIIKTAHVLGGLSLGEAEKLRKLMSKSKGIDKVEEYKEQFLSGAQERGIKLKDAEKVWAIIREAGAYTFGRSHTCAYSVISYHCAWLKTYYPQEFLTAVIQFNDGITMAKAINELRELGYTVKYPDINKSDLYAKIDDDGSTILGLTDIENVAEKSSREILEKRPFTSFQDFYERRTPAHTNIRVVRNLIQAGAFDEFGDRDTLYYSVTPDECEFDSDGQMVFDEWSEKELALRQFSVLNMPQEVPVVKHFNHEVEDFIDITPLDSIDFEDPEDEVYIKGSVTSVKVKTGYSKLKTEYAIALIDDGTDAVELLFGEEQLRKYEHFLLKDDTLFAIVKAHMVKDRDRLYADMVVDLEGENGPKDLEYMMNGRASTLEGLKASAVGGTELGLISFAPYFVSKKGNKGCNVIFSDGERLMCFQGLDKPLMAGDIIKYRVSKRPFINVLERY